MKILKWFFSGPFASPIILWVMGFSLVGSLIIGDWMQAGLWFIAWSAAKESLDFQRELKVTKKELDDLMKQMATKTLD